MTNTSFLVAVAIVAILPFTDRPWLAGLTPLGVWVGLAVCLLPLWLWVYADDLGDGNIR